MEKGYQIASWFETFEHSDNVKTVKGLRWFKAPAGNDSRGYIALCSAGERGAVALGVFQAVCQWAAAQPKERRGKLVHSDGDMMSLDEIAVLIRFPAELVSSAFELLASKRVKWIIPILSGDPPTIVGQSSDDPPNRVEESRVEESRVEEKRVEALSPSEPTPQEKLAAPVCQYFKQPWETISGEAKREYLAHLEAYEGAGAPITPDDIALVLKFLKARAAGKLRDEPSVPTTAKSLLAKLGDTLTRARACAYIRQARKPAQRPKELDEADPRDDMSAEERAAMVAEMRQKRKELAK